LGLAPSNSAEALVVGGGAVHPGDGDVIEAQVDSELCAMVDQVIGNPLVMIASDGFTGHPRNAGTYGRVFAQYVRERRSLTLMDAMRKMSYMPAQRLERCTPDARKKGRLQTGADADIVVFDPETFRDQSTFEKPDVPSTGVRYLMVNGTLVIDGGQLVSGVAPGRALVGFSGKDR